MAWPWISAEKAARLREERKARYIEIVRSSYEQSRSSLGPQRLKERGWDPHPAQDRPRPRADAEVIAEDR
ncbi:hypothetical protein [Enterovirga sp. CN4-39]|uniref:hypothetical protein n=1 Tax=Enterovirga sp. CN4-39 TaxID=3400910 RepID=UPI003C079D35